MLANAAGGMDRAAAESSWSRLLPWLVGAFLMLTCISSNASAAPEGSCTANPSNCVCSDALQGTFYTRVTEHGTACSLWQCSDECLGDQVGSELFSIHGLKATTKAHYGHGGSTLALLPSVHYSKIETNPNSRVSGFPYAGFAGEGTGSGTGRVGNGFNGWKDLAVAKGDTDAGQMIGLAAEVERGTPDTASPTAPTNLTVTPHSFSRTQLDLSWTASTDDVGVTGYHVERCSGVGCSNFSEIATASGTSYSDTGLDPKTAYDYRVRAHDAALNVSAYPTTIEGSTVWPIKVVPGERIMREANGTPWLMIADAPHSIAQNVPPPTSGTPNMTTYFASRQTYGINAVWVETLCNLYITNPAFPGAGCRADDSTYDGLTPFTTANNFTTTREAYWQRVDAVVTEAAAHGIVVLLDPSETGGHLRAGTCGGSNCGLNWFDSNTTAQLTAYGAWLGTRYKNYPNIIWLSGNDFREWATTSYNDKVRAIATGIRSTDTNHIHTLQLGDPVSDSGENTGWPTPLDFYLTYSYYPVYAQTAVAYARTTVKPVFFGEGPYDNGNKWCNDSTGRRVTYWSLLSGAMGTSSGNEHLVLFASNWASELAAPSVIQLGYAKTFFEARSWWLFQPDTNHSVVTQGYGTAFLSADGNYTDGCNSKINTNDYATAERASDGSSIVAYLPTRRTITVDMTKMSATALARWFDPSNGQYTTIGTYSNSGVQVFTPPAANSSGDNDFVLALDTFDNTPPTAPSNLTATAASGTQINLGWAAATDAVGVTAYRVERCQGVACTTFSEIGTATGTTYNDTGLVASTSYLYRVRAQDGASNLGPYSNTAQGTTAAPPPPLAGAWGFNEGTGTQTADASGNGNTGTLSGNTSWVASAKHDAGLSFDGSGDLVQVPSSSSLDVAGTTITVSFWAWIDASIATDGVFLEKPWTAGSQGSPPYQFGVEFGKGTQAANFYFGTTGGVPNGPFSVPLPTGTWTYITFTYDGSLVHGYRDGTLAVSTAAGGSIVARGNPLRIGVDSIGAQGFKGQLDDVRIYSRVLSVAEIQSDMNTGVRVVADTTPPATVESLRRSDTKP